MKLECLATSKWSLQKVVVYMSLKLRRQVWDGDTRFESNLQTMEVKFRQVDELTKGSYVKLLQEKTRGDICFKGMGRRRGPGTVRAMES